MFLILFTEHNKYQNPFSKTSDFGFEINNVFKLVKWAS